MSQTLSSRLLVGAALLAAGVGTASAAVVTRTYVINTATIVDLYSSTFDGALTPCNVGTPPDAQECAFFNGYTPVGRNITVTNVGTGNGTLTVDWETTTGEITQVREMLINLPDIMLSINSGGTTDVTVTQGNAYPVANDVPFIEAGTGTLNRDLDGAGPQTTLGTGSIDPDQGVAIGQATVFQHADPISNPDAPDFAVFNDVVDTCTGPYCGLISAYVITLDGIKYRLEGSVSATGGNALVLKAQTSNNSIYRVNFSTAQDTDADGVPDTADNCRLVSNANQCDSDSDGYGNRCDGDLNNNNFTNAQDTTLFKLQLGQPSVPPAYNKADINCNGFVNAQDNTLFRQLLGSPPGPGASP